jgi:hypothetical protein
VVAVVAAANVVVGAPVVERTEVEGTVVVVVAGDDETDGSGAAHATARSKEKARRWLRTK